MKNYINLIGLLRIRIKFNLCEFTNILIDLYSALAELKKVNEDLQVKDISK